MTNSYTVVVIGVKAKEKTFITRDKALKYMHSVCQKHGLEVMEVWDDHHDKAYICKNKVEIHINRN